MRARDGIGDSVGTDFEGRLIGLGDPRAQAEQAMKNVKQLLEEVRTAPLDEESRTRLRDSRLGDGPRKTANVGLDYLTLSRESGTLSGGESQRIRLASQIGSGLSGVVYVLDEPSIGLHQCDNERLLGTLEHLRSLGNTVIVVEHDEDTMRRADYLVDMGPGAGIHGGHVVAKGTPKQVMDNPKSVTGQYLAGTRMIEVPKARRQPSKNRVIRIQGARANNLKNVALGVANYTTANNGNYPAGQSNPTIVDTAATPAHSGAAGKNTAAQGHCTSCRARVGPCR